MKTNNKKTHRNDFRIRNVVIEYLFDYKKCNVQLVAQKLSVPSKFCGDLFPVRV